MDDKHKLPYYNSSASVNRGRVALESERFPRFEKSLERGLGSVYKEDWYYILPVTGGGMLAFFAFYLILFHFISESIIAVLLRFGILCGFAIVTYGLFIRKRALEKYRFRGLSRRTISAAIEYLDSAVVPVEQVEYAAPYHDGAVYRKYQLHELFEDYLRLMKCLRQMILWPEEQIGFAEEEAAAYRRRIGIMTFIAPLVGIILIALGLPLALTFESFERIIAMVLLANGVYAIGWIIVFVYRKIDFYNIKWFNDISISDNISLSDTLNEILSLLRNQYEHPLRFFVAGQYEVLTYTGRTKTTYTLARLKEAVLYPS